MEVGALVRHAHAERSSDIARHAPLITAAMPHIGHPAIRNRGTVGGSIAFADPAAELPACIIALNGELEIAGRKVGAGSRQRISFRRFSRPHWHRRMCSPLSAFPRRAQQPALALPSSPAVMATTRWWALPPVRARTASASSIFALLISASGPFRRARAMPRLPWPVATSIAQWLHCVRMCTRTTMCMRQRR